MNRNNWHIALILAAAVAAGCDTHEPETTPTTRPAATQAAAIPAELRNDDTELTAPPEAIPASAMQITTSQLTIADQVVSFPVARLRVNRHNGQVVARLYSDDPKAALKDDYVGNHYELLMNLDDIRDPQQIGQSVWQFKARSQEYVNEPYGIFLEGNRYQLQPQQATAHFVGDNWLVHIDLNGQFLVFDDRDKAAQPKLVDVRGTLMAQVEYKN